MKTRIAVLAGLFIWSLAASTQGTAQTSTGSYLPVDGNSAFKGPNPYIDVTEHGVRSVSSMPQTTCTIRKNSAVARLGSASTFQNGDGIRCYGAGATNRLATPLAPTVTPSVSGGTRYTYQIVARDINGGLTAASLTTTITTGPATLGTVSYTNSTLSRSGNAVTVTTSTANQAVVGQPVFVSGASDASFTGFFLITSVTSSANQFTYVQGMDTRAGATTSARGGTSILYAFNSVSWICSSCGAYQYYIYGRTSESIALIGVTPPGETSWRDMGSTFMGGIALPDFVPSTPPSSATNDYLSTTIVSGAGTTSVTLATAATNTVNETSCFGGPCSFEFDDAPGILAAATAARGKGTLRFPSTGSARYVVNSHLTLPSQLNVEQAGTLYLAETVDVGSATTWRGDSGGSSSSTPQFAWNSGRAISVGTAYPGLVFDGPADDFSHITFTSLAPQGLIATLGGINGGGYFNWIFDHDNFVINGNDYTGTAVKGYGAVNAHFLSCLFSTNDSNGFGYSLIPLLWFRNDLANLNASGNIFCNECFFIGRGFLIEQEVPLGTFGLVDFEHPYAQALRTPLVLVSTGNGGGRVRMDGFVNDTSITPHVVDWTNSAMAVEIYNALSNSDDAAGPTGIVSGHPISDLKVYGQTGPIGQNVNLVATYGVGTKPHIPGFGFSTQQIFRHADAVSIVPPYTLFSPLSAPTGVTANGAPAGSLSNGLHSVVVTSVGFDGGESGPSTVASATTSGSNNAVAVTWNPVQGAAGYNVYDAGVNTSVAQCQGITTTSCTYTSYSCCTNNIPNAAGTGTTVFGPSSIITPSLILTSHLNGGSISFSGTFTESNTANRTYALPNTSGTFALALSGSASGSTTALPANSCGDSVTAIVTGATTSMAVLVTPSAAPQPGLRPYAYVSSVSTVTLKYCNDTGGSITPNAQAFQIRVIQ